MVQPDGLLNYVVFSGKLLNNLGDMESCQLVVQGNYLLIEIKGEVQHPSLFSKGGKGRYYEQMTSLIGLCIPK